MNFMKADMVTGRFRQSENSEHWSRTARLLKLAVPAESPTIAWHQAVETVHVTAVLQKVLCTANWVILILCGQSNMIPQHCGSLIFQKPKLSTKVTVCFRLTKCVVWEPVFAEKVNCGTVQDALIPVPAIHAARWNIPPEPVLRKQLQRIPAAAASITLGTVRL